MTARAVLAAWIAVAALLASAAAVMILAAGPAPPLFHGAPVAVVGSSLMHSAIPNGFDSPGLLGDGRAHWRIGLGAITEDETAALLTHAIDEHAQVVFVEANALLFDFPRTRARGRCDHPAARLRRELKLLQFDITDVFARLVGKPGELDEYYAPAGFDQGMATAEQLRGNYPLTMRGPCRIDALEELASRARAQGTSIVLLIPPRATSAEALLGPIQQRMILDHAQALAQQLGAAVFIAGPWPDAEFVDGGHLNQRGRAHFIAALRQWWRRRQ